MNPYNPFFTPKTVTVNMTVEHANAVINQFHKERDVAVGDRAKAQTNLDAIQDAMSQAYPQAVASFEELSFWAQAVGYADCEHADISTLENQYRSALPANIKPLVNNPAPPAQ